MNESELLKLRAGGSTEGSAAPLIARRVCRRGRVDVRGSGLPSAWGGSWAPSIEEAPDVATHRPFTAGITEAPVAAPNFEPTGILGSMSC